MSQITLEQLTLLNYKNIEDAQLRFCPGINCLVGLNGQGKTNVLDAIYYLSFCKSRQANIDSQNIKHDQEFFMIQGEYNLDSHKEEISCSVKRRQKKHFRRNKHEYERLSEHIGLLPLVLISPNDISLIGEGSEERRRFMDSIISQYDKRYLQHLLIYNNAVQQRNALLKQETRPDESAMEVYEDVMDAHAGYIFERRLAFIEQIVPRFQKFYDSIADNAETVSLHYQSQLQNRNLKEALRQTRERDYILGWTSQGIHKDDLEMQLGEWPIKRVGSQGQQKTYLISLKFAQFDFLQQTLGVKPILLLDDLFDKLDTHRMNQIIRLVSSEQFGQIFITDTDRSHLLEALQQVQEEKKIFNVSEGHIEQTPC